MSASLFSVNENAICNTNVHPSTLPFLLPSPCLSPLPFLYLLTPSPSTLQVFFARPFGVTRAGSADPEVWFSGRRGWKQFRRERSLNHTKDGWLQLKNVPKKGGTRSPPLLTSLWAHANAFSPTITRNDCKLKLLYRSVFKLLLNKGNIICIVRFWVTCFWINPILARPIISCN